MDSDRAKAYFASLESEIQKTSVGPLDQQNEVKRRQLWRDLELFKMSIDDSSQKVSPEVKEQIMASYTELSKMLTLRPFAKRSGGLRGAVAFGAFFFMTTIMFPVFTLAFPLRWMHPLLRKIGIINNRLPYDFVPRMWAKWAMLLFGIQAKLEGWEHVQRFYETGKSTIGLFEHSSFFDFIVVMGSCDILFKWVSKKSLYRIPFLGMMGYMAGMIPIDRSNLESAKKSLDYAAYVAQHYERSIAIAPEGTRSTNGQLAEFKKGAFHLALQCQVDATPLVLFGAYHLWPPNTICPSPGTVTLRFLKPIPTQNYLNLEGGYNHMLKDTRTAMLESMASPPPHIIQPTSTAFALLSGASVAATYALTAVLGYGIWKYFH